MISTLKLAISIAITSLAGVIGSIFTTPSKANWYGSIIKPSINPPSWVFGPVWTILYILMGVSLYLIWQKGLNHPGVKTALLIFAIQLILNALWSILFFGLHSIGWALVEIIFLWVAIACSIIYFYDISKLAAWLQLPYILWVSFAMYLNYLLYSLNNKA